MRVLLVEDDEPIADFIERGLRLEGYDVATAADGVDGERQALSGDVDLVVLDLMLPGQDGLEVLRALRERRPGLPVILLTARGDVPDRVAGLDAGATDYVTKPFAFAELVARIRAHLRSPLQGPPTVLEAAGIRLDLLDRRVDRDGVEIALSEKEFELLAYLVRNAGQVVSRARVLRDVWGYDAEPQTKVVDVYIGYLRRKLALSGSPAPIATIRAAGYRLERGD
jgi:DNA-binding response OmpR family regulator